MENRTIKFRAWCSGQHNLLTFTNPIMDYDVVLSKNGYWLDVESEWDIKDEYPTIPIMQFTGLHDKNGKEIYEGDIIRDSSAEYQVWIEEGAMLIGGKSREWDQFLRTFNVAKMEVIGNIYENPELLTTK